MKKKLLTAGMLLACLVLMAIAAEPGTYTGFNYEVKMTTDPKPTMGVTEVTMTDKNGSNGPKQSTPDPAGGVGVQDSPDFGMGNGVTVRVRNGVVEIRRDHWPRGIWGKMKPAKTDTEV